MSNLRYFKSDLVFDGTYFIKYGQFAIHKDDIIYLRRRYFFEGVIIYLRNGLKIKLDCNVNEEQSIIDWFITFKTYEDDEFSLFTAKDFTKFQLLCDLIKKYKEKKK